jgi:hypothetical protein
MIPAYTLRGVIFSTTRLGALLDAAFGASPSLRLPRVAHGSGYRLVVFDDLADIAEHDPAELGVGTAGLDHHADLGVPADVEDLLRLRFRVPAFRKGNLSQDRLVLFCGGGSDFGLRQDRTGVRIGRATFGAPISRAFSGLNC